MRPTKAHNRPMVTMMAAPKYAQPCQVPDGVRSAAGRGEASRATYSFSAAGVPWGSCEVCDMTGPFRPSPGERSVLGVRRGSQGVPVGRREPSAAGRLHHAVVLVIRDRAALQEPTGLRLLRRFGLGRDGADVRVV